MYQFKIKGHRNLLATHKTTIEFTKDKELTKEGDCIVGVEANFNKSELLKEFAFPKIVITISCQKRFFTFYATPNKMFSSDKELVFRKTNFISERTGGTFSSKAAADLPEVMRSALQKSIECNVMVKGLPIGYLFFDFDDTLCDFSGARNICHLKMAEFISHKYNKSEKRVVELLDIADMQFPKQASAKDNVLLFDRHKWFEWIFGKLDLHIDKKEINQCVDKYWECMITNMKSLDGAKEILVYMSRKYKLGIFSDADGKKEYKLTRLKKNGLIKFFEAFALGDELRVVKPNPTLLFKLLMKFNAKPEECVAIGDKPWVDLLPAKKLGMITVWFNNGIYSKQMKTKPDYVDYVITNITELKQFF